MMTFESDLEGDKVVFTLKEGLNVDQVMQAFRRFLLASGYHPDNISEYIPEE